MITLQYVTADDWELWSELRLKALTNAPAAFSSKLHEWADADEARWRLRLTEVPLNIVAFHNGSAAGMVSATRPNQQGQILLISMWVTPAQRGHGVGDALIGAVIEWANEQRVQSVVLDVAAANDPAIKLYKRNHFIDIGTSPDSACERRLERKLS